MTRRNGAPRNLKDPRAITAAFLAAGAGAFLQAAECLLAGRLADAGEALQSGSRAITQAEEAMEESEDSAIWG